MHTKGLVHTVGPVYPVPPHWPYCVWRAPGVLVVDVFGGVDVDGVGVLLETGPDGAPGAVPTKDKNYYT